MNYLNQAIKSWETALDSIESAVYMQSQTLALPVYTFKLNNRIVFNWLIYVSIRRTNMQIWSISCVTWSKEPTT